MKCSVCTFVVDVWTYCCRWYLSTLLLFELRVRFYAWPLSHVLVVLEAQTCAAWCLTRERLFSTYLVCKHMLLIFLGFVTIETDRDSCIPFVWLPVSTQVISCSNMKISDPFTISIPLCVPQSVMQWRHESLRHLNGGRRMLYIHCGLPSVNCALCMSLWQFWPDGCMRCMSMPWCFFD